MANNIQRLTVRLLAKPEMHSIALAIIADILQRAVSGDATAASEGLVICAEIFRQQVPVPTEIVSFLSIALDRASLSNEACCAIASFGGVAVKAGAPARHAQDTNIYAHDTSLLGKV